MSRLLIDKTKSILLKKIDLIPRFAIITGSGVKVFKEYTPIFEISYTKLPVWKKKLEIKGHESMLKLYRIKDIPILVFSGRHHLYQGYDIPDVVSNIKLAYELGIKKIIITNAAGGIKKSFTTGSLMLITGFINLMQSTERGTLSSITQIPVKIKTPLTELIEKKFKLTIEKGIYAANIGPTYETYSEIKLLQDLGASAIGMSTIPEMICTKSLNLDFAGISIISNAWNPTHKPSHLDVLKAVTSANDKLNSLLHKIIDN